MRLLNPGFGEILDRLSILELKIQHAASEQRDDMHWLKEREELLGHLASRGDERVDLYHRIIKLSIANARMWAMNELVYKKLPGADRPYSEVLAVDQIRHDAVRDINDRLGTSQGGPEKLL